ncbi:hypothetical protein [Actinomycetospora chiangmaiensis]|uniref:hypothetical protein n=1 Tax=Actinomycetospora chiangmaiensis TaxID=402650 RepID=UPI0012F993DF|nr:hypothetical protein [Actinomycetospora chiangmaiensis]
MTSVLDRAVRFPGERLVDLARTVEDIAGDPLFAILLARLRYARTTLLEVAARSSWHSNGFAKIVLDADEDPRGRKLRLHVWPETVSAAPRGETDPHGHRWNFASTVLVGTGLDVVEWEVVPDDGELFGGYAYDPLSGEPLVGGIEMCLREGTPVLRPRGDVYLCGTDIVHTVEPRGRDVTASLVVQGRVTRQAAWVYRKEPAAPYRTPRRLTPDEVIDLVGLVVDAL